METFSLSELLEAVKITLNDNLPDRYWVRAEVSSISQKSGGHCYLELTDSDDADHALTAKVRANCWRNIWTELSERFTVTTGQAVQTGMQVLVLVSVDFHSVYGLSLIVHDIDPVFSLGDIARRRLESIARLEKAGLLERQQSLSLPSLPQRIAVVSSPTAAGWQDFQHQLENNLRHYAFRTTLFEAVMQGENAAESIADALQRIRQQLTSLPAFDALVIIRGGGAATDLGCFDDYMLAAMCAVFPLPVITGIGHTRDVSLVDMVAYKSLKTPTAVAEYFVSLADAQATAVQELELRLRQTATRFTERSRNVLTSVVTMLQGAFRHALAREKLNLDMHEKTVMTHSPEHIFRKGYTLTTINGKTVHSAAELKRGDVITTEWHDGKRDSVVS